MNVRQPKMKRATVVDNGDGSFTLTIRISSVDEGLKHDSWIMCDNLRSLPKTDLTQFVGTLSSCKLSELDRALRIAVGVD